MIEKTEIAPSGRSLCTKCKQFIPKGGRRGIIKEMSFNHPVKKYYCWPCTKNLLTAQIIYSQSLLIDLG